MRPLAALLAFGAAVTACHHDGGNTAGARCASIRDCGKGLLCLSGACAESAPRAGACAPPSSARLVAGLPMTATDPGAGVCTTDVRPAAPGVQVQDLGEHTVGEQLSFAVPAGTWSVTVVSQEVGTTAVDFIQYLGSPLPNSVVPTDVRAPDGRLFYTDTPSDTPTDASGYPDYTGFLAYYGGFTPTSGAMTLPNTAAGLDAVRSAGELPAGTWRLTVNDFAYECPSVQGCVTTGTPGRYAVQVITRPGPIASTGTLDLDVYLATDMLTAASAPANPHAQRLFGTLSTVLAGAGLCLGTVTFHDLPDWARTRYRSVNVDGSGPCDPLSQLFTLALAPSPSVHLFLVDELTVTASGSGATYQIIGIDGSIPGPSGVPGTINGGAAVPVYDLAYGACAGPVDVAHCGADRIAYTLAHEAGHWLGLYHTTERYGSLFDPLADTATCGCNACAPMTDRAACAENAPQGDPTSMLGKWCDHDAPTCGGASNLMFWLLDDQRSRAALTAQQAEVMRLNPAVH